MQHLPTGITQQQDAVKLTDTVDNDCDKLSNQSLDVQQVHAEVVTQKPYKCKRCDKSFSTRSGCKVHEQHHTGVKPFKCMYCDKVFSASSHCKNHERLHTGDTPHQCKHCNKRFRTLSEYEVHERSHTGVKPYKCK